MLTIIPCPSQQLPKWLDAYQRSLTSPIDSFLEARILEGRHYQIEFEGVPAGLTTIHSNTTLVLLYLALPFTWLGQVAFEAVRKIESVQTALVPTCDEHFLSLTIEHGHHVEPQAYFFQRFADEPIVVKTGFALRPAGLSDHELVQQHSGDFFAPIDHFIERNELFIGTYRETLVSFGISERSQLQPNVASIGMFVLPERRRKGHGTNTLLALQEYCLENGYRPVAGCAYHNHLSKKTLEKAGLHSRTRLLKATL